MATIKGKLKTKAGDVMYPETSADKVTGLATVATSGSYNDLSNKPTIPTVNNATLTIQKNGSTVKTFTANASSDVTCNITVPTTAADVGAATSGHTHTLSLATDTGTSSITLAHSGKYKLTAGGNSVVFTLPSDNNTVPNNGTFTLKVAGTSKGTFTADQSGNTTIDITASDLGLSSAMKFLGTSATAITDGATTNPITIGSTSTTVTSGNVVLYGAKEFVWTGSAWEELGNEGSYALSTVKVEGTGALGGGGNLTTNRTITHNEVLGTAQTTAKVFKTKIDKYGHISEATEATASDVGAATSGHTHTLSLATDTGTSSLTLSHGGKYKLTAGGNSLIFTLPSDNNTNYYQSPSYSSGLQISTGTGVNSLYVPNASTSQKGVLTLSKDNLNTMINQLDTGSSDPVDGDYFISQYVNGGTTTTTFHRRPVSKLYNYMKGKMDSVYAASGHTHTLSLATDSGTSTVDLAANTKYKLTAGGNTLIFKTPAVNNATLTIQKNGTTVNTFTANASSDVTANITVPTKVSDLTNDSGFTTNTGNVTGSSLTNNKLVLGGGSSAIKSSSYQILENSGSQDNWVSNNTNVPTTASINFKLFGYAKVEDLREGLYNLGYYDTYSNGTITRKTGYLRIKEGEWDLMSTSTSGKNRFVCKKYKDLIKKPSSTGTVAEIVCSAYTTQTADAVWSCSTGIAVDSGGSICVFDSAYAPNGTTGMNNWISASKDLVIQYKLADSEQYTERVVAGYYNGGVATSVNQCKPDTLGDIDINKTFENLFNPLLPVYSNSGMGSVNRTKTSISCTYSSSASDPLVILYPFFIPAGTYTLSYTGTNSQYIVVKDENASGYVGFAYSGNPFTFTLSSNTLISLRFDGNPGQTSCSFNNIMLNEGSIAQPFREFYGGRLAHEQNLYGDLLWSNGNTSSNFGGQTISPADMSNYKYIVVLVSINSGYFMPAVFKFQRIVGKYFLISHAYNGKTYYRQCNIASNTSISFSGAYENTTENNGYLTPFAIYGTNTL